MGLEKKEARLAKSEQRFERALNYYETVAKEDGLLNLTKFLGALVVTKICAFDLVLREESYMTQAALEGRVVEAMTRDRQSNEIVDVNGVKNGR